DPSDGATPIARPGRRRAVSTEISVGDLHLSFAEDSEPTSQELDTHRRAMETVGDRPHTETLPAMVDPAADHLDPEVMERRADVDEKHRRVVEFLDRNGYDGALLGRADAAAWFTSGGDLRRDLGCEAASVLIYVN